MPRACLLELSTLRPSTLEARQGLEKLQRLRREQGRDGRRLGGKEGSNKEGGKVQRGGEGGFLLKRERL